MWRTIRPGFVFSLLALWALSGCGEEPRGGAELPDMVPFSGIVKLDGKPLAGAGVTFMSTAEKGFNATAITDADGKYELKTRHGQEEKPGAVPGNYKVQISRPLQADGQPQDLTKPAEVPGVESLPPRYSSPTETQLDATVAAGSTKDFELRSR